MTRRYCVGLLVVLLALSLCVYAADPQPGDKDKTIPDNVKDAKGLDDALRNLRAKLVNTPALSPAESLKAFKVPPDLAVDLVAAEPVVKQPVYVSFDERGRMWVVQYIQYPFPAGLKVLSYDKYIRAVFDKVPLPPPHHTRGLDKITIHESSKGDGVYDKSKTFVEGLNITTAALPGHGGVWVLNPPYLLFYPDKDRRDIAVDKPEVHLSGFGLEDTHAVANSLAWGPDGWLYGAQGSTCTAKVKAHFSGSDRTTDFLGQAIWRYHPVTHQFELFAEGGGNTFGVEFDDQGRLFSGTNGGAYRGLYYVQGGYYIKAWGKHGPLTNPYALGWLDHMAHTGSTERFTHTFIVYGGGLLPEAYNGKLIAVNPLQSRVQLVRQQSLGSSFQTSEEPFLLTTTDGWFRPIDVKTGPDGAVYLTDFYEARINHVDPRDNWDRSNGRIYRLRPKEFTPSKPVDLAKLTGPELVEHLHNKNRWQRQTALRLLYERKDASLIPLLTKTLADNTGQFALESLWALHACGGLTDAAALKTLDHADAFVRMWTVRLIGDRNTTSPAVADKLASLAAKETDAQVRSQLASSAKRLPGSQALPIIAALLKRTDDVTDPQIPLLVWWALESKAETDRDAVLALFRERELWKKPLVDKVIVERLMQRYALAGGAANLQACATLLRQSPDAAVSNRLLAGLDKAFAGRNTSKLPDDLRDAVAKAWQSGATGTMLTLGIRIGNTTAIDKALSLIADEKSAAAKRLECIRIFGEVEQARCVPVLLNLLQESRSAAVRQEALGALQRYDDPRIGERVVALYPAHLPEQDGVRSAALALVSSRPSWSLQFLQAIDAGKIDARSIPLDVVRSIKLHADKDVTKLVEKHWGQVRPSTTAEKQKEMLRLGDLLKAGQADAKAGKLVFTNTCAKCHKLFGAGGNVGPDLTGYERSNKLYWIENIVDPSAVIREEYVTFIVETKDGRKLTGIIAEQDKQSLTLRDQEGRTKKISRDQIDDLHASPLSLMPEDQMKALTEQQIRDLFAYLMAKTPPGK
jgi:putative membrane-bound dehydrogenase-like protein